MPGPRNAQFDPNQVARIKRVVRAQELQPTEYQFPQFVPQNQVKPNVDSGYWGLTIGSISARVDTSIRTYPYTPTSREITTVSLPGGGSYQVYTPAAVSTLGSGIVQLYQTTGASPIQFMPLEIYDPVHNVVNPKTVTVWSWAHQAIPDKYFVELVFVGFWRVREADCLVSGG